MAEKIKTGTILIEEGAIFPASFRLESEPYAIGWRLLTDLDGYGLDRRIREAGWTSFYMAGEVNASAVALDGDRSLHRALSQILKKLKLQRFNSLEITQVTAKRFMGLPHTTVSAHPRHIQESIFLFDWMTKARAYAIPA